MPRRQVAHAVHCDARDCLTPGVVALHIPPSRAITTVSRQKSSQSCYNIQYIHVIIEKYINNSQCDNVYVSWYILWLFCDELLMKWFINHFMNNSSQNKVFSITCTYHSISYRGYIFAFPTPSYPSIKIRIEALDFHLQTGNMDTAFAPNFCWHAEHCTTTKIWHIWDEAVAFVE